MKKGYESSGPDLNRHFEPHPRQSNGNIQGGIAHLGTNSALRASSSAIKRNMEGRIAHLGHQFGTFLAIKRVTKGGIAHLGHNSALRASSLAIKK